MKNMNSTVVMAISVVVGLLLFGGLFYFLRANKQEEQVTLPVELQEFSDFQCPACGAYYPVVEQIRSEFSAEELEFNYRHLPLTQIHEYAYNSAIAAEAAREQGKFEEYHDLLFENQDKLTDDDLILYAEQLELDMEKFRTDLENPDVKARVEADIAEADEKGYNSTPTFELNGKRLSMGSDPAATLKEAIQEKIELAKKQASESSN